jgi:peroxiredoxin
VPILVTIAGICVIALLAYGISTGSASRTIDERVARGQHPPAPDASHELPVLGGHGLRALAAYRGDVVVLNFWASWCPPCIAEAPRLEEAQQRLQKHRAVVLGVTYRDAAPASEHFIRAHDLTYPNLRDNTGDFAGAFGTDQLPETFIVDRSGHIVDLRRGEIDKAFLHRAIELAERS